MLTQSECDQMSKADSSEEFKSPAKKALVNENSEIPCNQITPSRCTMTVNTNNPFGCIIQVLGQFSDKQVKKVWVNVEIDLDS